MEKTEASYHSLRKLKVLIHQIISANCSSQGSYLVPEQPGSIKTNGVRMHNPDSTTTDGLCNKNKSEVDPDSNSTTKVD